MQETPGGRIAVYSRKSKFTGKGESIENQIELCRQYIRAHFPNCAEKNVLIYEDEGFSGGNTERPQFKRMMLDAGTKKFVAVVCYRLDRVSRNIGDFVKLITELEALKIAFVSIREQFDTSSPLGRAMMYIASVFSQLERETIAERIRDNMHELAKTGRWLGGTTPTGYVSESVESVTAEGKSKTVCRLKLVPEEAGVVRHIFAKFLETNSLSQTETYFLQNGYKSKTGRGFSRFALKNILTNPVYMIADQDAYNYMNENEAGLSAEKADFDGSRGVMAYNRTAQRAGKTNRLRPLHEWIVSVGGHTGLISGADWVKTQKCLEQNRSKAYRKPRENAALFSGLLFCANCGEHMRPKLAKRKAAQDERSYSYLCSLKERSRCHSCRAKNADGNLLDRAVYGEIAKLEGEAAEFLRLLEHGRRRLSSGRGEYAGELRLLRKNLAENEKEIAALAASLQGANGTGAEEYLVRRIGERHGQSESLKRRIGELTELSAVRSLSNSEFEAVRQKLSSFEHTLESMSVEEKRAALRELVQKVVWDGENARVYLRGGGEEPSCEDSK